jgi:hypothetical protein
MIALSLLLSNFGFEVNKAARLLSAGWGGQILLSSSALETCGIPVGASIENLILTLLSKNNIKVIAEFQKIQLLTILILKVTHQIILFIIVYPVLVNGEYRCRERFHNNTSILFSHIF